MGQYFQAAGERTSTVSEVALGFQKDEDSVLQDCGPWSDHGSVGTIILWGAQAIQ